MDENFEALIKAVKENLLTAVQEILSDKGVNFDINQVTDPEMERTILHVALLNKIIDVGIVKLLLHNNAKLNAQDYYERTPLHSAVKNNRIDVVELLLKHGADPNCIDEFGRTPFNRCINTGNMLLMNLMLKYKADVNIKDCHGNNTLHLAARYGTYETVKRLIQMGMNVNEITAYGDTPLHRIFFNFNGNTEYYISKIRLLVDNGADVNAVNDYNDTPLCQATKWRLKEGSVLKIVHCLLELGANPNIYGYESPLWHAALNHDVEAVELLIKYGANVYFMRGSLTLMNAVTGLFAWRASMEDVNVQRALCVAKLLLIRGVTLEENHEGDDFMFLFDLFRLLKDCQSEYNNLKTTRTCKSCPLTYGDLLIARNECLVRYLRREDFRTAIKSAINNKNFVKYFSDDLKKKCTSGFELIKMLDDLVDLLDEVFETVLTHDVVVVISQYFNEDDLKKCFDGNQEHL